MQIDGFCGLAVPLGCACFLFFRDTAASVAAWLSSFFSILFNASLLLNLPFIFFLSFKNKNRVSSSSSIVNFG